MENVNLFNTITFQMHHKSTDERIRKLLTNKPNGDR